MLSERRREEYTGLVRTSPQHTVLADDVEMAQSGDRSAFGRVMDATMQMAYRLAYRALGTVADAEDVCQEAYIRVWEHFPKYDRSRPFEAWLTTIVSRLAIDRLRQRQRSPWWSFRRDGETHVAETAVSSDLGADQKAVLTDLHDVVVGLAGSLPPTQRIVFVLRDLEDLEVAEVASVTGLSTSSVKANLSYARRRIRETLIRDFRVEEIAS